MFPEAGRVVVAWGGGWTLTRQVGTGHWGQTFPRHFLLFCQLPGKAVFRRGLEELNDLWRAMCMGGSSNRAGAESSTAWRSRHRERGAARGSLWGLGVGVRSRLYWRDFRDRDTKEGTGKTPHISGSASWATRLLFPCASRKAHNHFCCL